MLGLCELTGCRRQALLRYFGEEREQPCGNCDTCLEPPETWDATVAAQKALSCVHRTGQRFGVNYLVDVLLGKEHERIRQFGHDSISTYGIGEELNQSEWRNLYRQLIAHGLLSVDVEGYGALRLAEASRPVLRGEQRLHLRKVKKPAKGAKRERAARRFDNGAEERLWQALRSCRQCLAEERAIPPYMVFHDATLMEMMANRPQTLTQLAQISGVGARKLEEYGEAFIEVLAEHDEGGAGDSVGETLQLFRLGMDVTAIAARRELKPGTVYTHLAAALEQGEVALDEVVSLSESELATIRFAFEQAAEGGEGVRLKPVFEALEGRYDYGLLRCIKVALERQ
jgi:ATP-dependent DNA helicase RecQ